MMDEYYTESREAGTDPHFFVYRQVGQRQIDYCECQTRDAAGQIARALNLCQLLLEGQIVQSFLFEDGSEIFLVVQGEQAEQAYLQAWPLLKEHAGHYQS